MYHTPNSLNGDLEQSTMDMVVSSLMHGEEIDLPREKEITRNKNIYTIVFSLSSRTENGKLSEICYGLSTYFLLSIE